MDIVTLFCEIDDCKLYKPMSQQIKVVQLCCIATDVYGWIVRSGRIKKAVDGGICPRLQGEKTGQIYITWPAQCTLL